MKWFRLNIRHGARLALLALAVQFGFSFGHFHETAAQAALAIQSASTLPGVASGVSAPDTAGQAAQQQSPSSPDSDQPSSDPCAICAVIALANTVLWAMPPLLPLPQAIESRCLTPDASFVHLDAACVAFQPRAPPSPDIDSLILS